jgi:negative regulator of sigma E activity
MRQPTPDQLPSRANTHRSQQARRAWQRSMQALGVAILTCLTMSWANAQYREPDALPVDSPAPEAQPTTQQDSSAEVWLAPVVIESEPMNPEPTQTQLLQKFHDALAQPRIVIVAEHRFSGDALEVTTRFGRFCANPPPGHVESGLGGDITLAAPCALF